MESHQLFACPICYEDFDLIQYIPKMIPVCGHTLCSSCLSILSNSQDILKCPLDNQIFSKNTNFPVNFILKQILETRLEQQICPEHRKEITFFCLTDKKKACSRCFENYHQGHQLQTIDSLKETTNSLRRQLKGLVNDSDSYHANFQRLLDEKRSTQLNSIKEKFQKIKDLISEKEQQLVHETNVFFDIEKNRAADLIGPESDLVQKMNEKEALLADYQNNERILIDSDLHLQIQDQIKEFRSKIGSSEALKKSKEGFEKIDSILNANMILGEKIFSEIQLPLLDPLETLFQIYSKEDNPQWDPEIGFKCFKVTSHYTFEYSENCLKISKKYKILQDSTVNLNQWKEIKEVKLSLARKNAQEDIQTISYVWNKLKDPKSLELKFSSDFISEELYQALKRSPNSFSSIKIIVKCKQISDQSNIFALIEDILSRAKDLKKLSVIMTEMILPDNFALIAENIMKHVSTLTDLTLDFENTEIDEEDFSHIFVPLPELKTLSLYLSNTNLGDQTIEFCSLNTLGPAKYLEELNLYLHSTKVTDDGILNLLNSLREPKKIDLDIGESDVTSKTVMLMGSFISRFLNTLEQFKLGLGGLKLPDEGFDFLFQPLPKVKTFLLSLWDTGITDRTIQAFTEKTLPYMNALESLSLWFGGTKVTNTSIKMLLSKLQNLKEISFDLDHTQITDDIVEYFVKDKLPSLKSLEKVNFKISNTAVTEKVQEQLEVVIQSLNNSSFSLE